MSPLEAILGRHGAVLGPLRAILGSLGGMLGHLGGLGGPRGPFWKPWRAMLAAWMALLGRLGTFGDPLGSAMPAQGPPGVGVVHATGCGPEAGGSLRRLQKPCQTARGILPSLNVPRGTVADTFNLCATPADRFSVFPIFRLGFEFTWPEALREQCADTHFRKMYPSLSSLVFLPAPSCAPKQPLFDDGAVFHLSG